MSVCEKSVRRCPCVCPLYRCTSDSVCLWKCVWKCLFACNISSDNVCVMRLFWECTRNMWAGMHVRPGVWTLHVCIVVSLYAFFWRDLYTSINVREQNKHTFAHTHKHVCICSIYFNLNTTLSDSKTYLISYSSGCSIVFVGFQWIVWMPKHGVVKRGPGHRILFFWSA